ncbi:MULTISPECIES: GntR family transcriptional regulator [Bacillaceae]|jgi:DNA-binding transcriptional regulator YhcF (GntR family)|uniref:GntR family transcriptional regulator n=2 Tax=Gottfriedia TaxID=2837503 RepID=A0ABY4JMU0_9BACI|nr:MULTISPECIES: GntR family transcriptional regulator [Bacillaceae]ODG90546.1 GntR family transcriptional regulator [Gottfriedia luciferensis]PEC51694.1 GntR family transcriptional regulator [Bacillus sp. AFS096315]PFM81824.1 GntR family transcriptional regulator [Bacillus sp. AFS077874]PGZ94231.1 GntR family transcriptional regulator [Bacillus sp. AFS029533]UPM54047.1 GntR family transcriptional regulator [Gottfriedia acidiceleris]
MEFIVNNREPVYLQVVRHFKQQIAKRLLEAGQEIPSRRELAVQFNINPNTVQKAYKEMEEQGLITTERNFPSKITTDIKVLNGVRNELIMEAVNEFVDSIKVINVPVEELLTMVKQNYEQKIKEEGKGEA